MKVKGAIYNVIHHGLDSRDIQTKHIARKFAHSIKRTSVIAMEEKAHHATRKNSQDYLKQLALMTQYLLEHKEAPIEKRMQHIYPKLREMELHQMHHLIQLRKRKIARKTKQARKGKKSQGKAKARKRKKRHHA